MRYFELLNLRREPFSNSPDPDLFYHAKQHRECLQSLEIALRLKRGLSVVTGHVGTGKTTLCRQLIRVLGERQGVVNHLILDPSFTDTREFLLHLNEIFGVDRQEALAASDWQLRENIKSSLFRLAVEEDRLVVLIVDEGQKMSLECLEILRELLNYETNEHKLLQIVIFGQLEFEPILEAKANLADRVNLRFRLGPLDFQDTRELIQARLAMCSKDISPEGLFSFWALLGVYLATDGFPRQIVQLCHQALLAVIIKERPRVTWGVVRSCMRWRTLGLPRRRRWPRIASAVLILVLIAAVPAAYLKYLPGDAARLRGLASRVELPDVSGWYSGLKGYFASRPQAAPPGPGGQAQPEGRADARPGEAGPGAKPGAAPPSPPAGQTQGQTQASPPVPPVTAGQPLEAAASPVQASPGQTPVGQKTSGKGAQETSSAVQTAAGQTPSGQSMSASPSSGDASSTVKSDTQSGTAVSSSAGQTGTHAPQSPVSPESPGSGQAVDSRPSAPAAETPSPSAQGADSPGQPGQTEPIPAERQPGPPRFTGVLGVSNDGGETLDILTSQPVERFDTSFKPNPSRIIVDIMGPWERRTDREIPIGSSRIDKVRSAVHPDKLRVAIYLKDASAGNVQPEVEKTALGLRVILK